MAVGYHEPRPFDRADCNERRNVVCKFILSLSIVLVCASLAGAEGHFSFAEIDLSFTPQQMAARGIDLWRHDKAGFGSQSSSVRSSIKFGNDDDIEIEYSPIDYAQISAIPVLS